MNNIPPPNPNLPSPEIQNLQNAPSAVNPNHSLSSLEQAAYFASLVAAGKGSLGNAQGDQGSGTAQPSGSNTVNTSGIGQLSGSNTANTSGVGQPSGPNTVNTTGIAQPSGPSNANTTGTTVKANTMIHSNNVNTFSGTGKIPASTSEATNDTQMQPLLNKQLVPVAVSSSQVSDADAVAAALINIQNMQPIAVQTTSVTASRVDTSAMINQIATQVANQILVSAPGFNRGPQIVTVILNENILPSTQINIHRDNMGIINVTFNTQNADSAQVLNGLQNTIQASLSTNLGQVNLAVSMTAPGMPNTSGSALSGSGSGSGSQGAPASGFEGDAGQGRSRGQYIPQEELPN